MSSMSDFFLINSLIGSKKEKYADPMSTYKKIKKILEEEKKGKEEKKDDKKKGSAVELATFIFAMTFILGPALVLIQLSYIVRIAEILQQHH